VCSGGPVKAGAVGNVVVGDGRMSVLPSSERNKSCGVQASWRECRERTQRCQ
jgi:hypothetical protein